MSWTRFFRRRAVREESAQELEAYLETETEDNIARGMSPEQARRAARMKLGSVTSVLEEMTKEDSLPWLETVWQDVRFGQRILWKDRGFAFVSVLTLALGIGANTAIFSMIDALLIRPLPYPNANRLAMVWERRMPDGERQNVTSPGTFLDWQEHNTVFDQMAAMFNDSSILTGGEMPEQVATASVSPNFFAMLGVNAAMGRVFVASQDGTAGTRVAVLGFEVWQRHFGADPAVVGSKIMLDDKPYTVVGVMPRGFEFFVKQQSFSQKKPEIWVVMNFAPGDRSRHGRYLQAMGLLHAGTTVAQAQGAMLSLAAQLEAQDPAALKNWSVNLVPLREQLVGDVTQGLKLVFAVVALVLLMACANVATLNLARASGRRNEIAIRMALGAGRGRVVRQVLTESSLLAAMGGVAGFALGYLCLSVLKSIAPANLIPTASLHLDLRVFAFAAVVSLTTGILFGILPAFDASRTAPRQGLQEGAQAGRGGERTGLARRALVVGEVAIALILLTGCGLLVHSFQRIMEVDPGFRAEGVLTAWLQFPNARYEKDEQKNQFFAQVLESVRGIPGVRSASADAFLPFAGIIAATGVDAEGRAVLPESQKPVADVSLVEPGFFETLGIPLIAGRSFEPREAIEATGNVVISQSMAQSLWPNQNAIGKHVTIYMKRDNKPSTVIGVVGDVKHAALSADVHPTAYWAYPELGFQFMTLVVRTDGDPRALIPAVREAVLRVDKNQPLADVIPMDTLVSASIARTRFALQVVGVFAGLALLLAVTGIYGVVSYDVTRRAREIGIRMALGARRATVIAAVLKRGAVLVVAGVACGLVASLALTRLLKGILYQTRPNEPAVFLLVALVLMVVALGAGFFGVRRISRIEPMDVLRCE